MILLRSINASVSDIRNYNKNYLKITKLKRSTLLRELNLKKKDIQPGNYYKVISEENKRGLFSLEYTQREVVPLTKKITEPLLIKSGSYTLKEPTLITSLFTYKHRLLKSDLTLQEDIVFKKGTPTTAFMRTLQEIFVLTPYSRVIIPAYVIKKDKSVLDLGQIKNILDSFSTLFFKKVGINNNIYIMDVEKLKILISVLFKKLESPGVLSEENKKLKEDLESLSFNDLFSAFANSTIKEQKKEQKKEEKVQEVIKKVEEDEDLDFF